MKTKVVYIYGAPAVGKLTTAKALSEVTGFKLFHNHLTSDLVRAIFDRGNPTGDMLIVRLRFELLEAAVQEQVSGIIITAAHAHNFMYPNGESDDWFATQLEEITVKNGGEFYGIHLTTTNEMLLERVVEADRLAWKKIHDKAVLVEALQKNDYSKSAPLNNNLTIDNTSITVSETVAKIADFVGCRLNTTDSEVQK